MLDYKLNPSWVIRAMAGLESFNASGEATTAICVEADDTTLTTSCETSISYLTIEGFILYYLTNSKYSFWLGAGAGFGLPSGAESTAVDEDSISTASLVSGTVGLDIALSSSSYIPIQAQYTILPSSSTVSGNLIAFRIGYMFSF